MKVKVVRKIGVKTDNVEVVSKNPIFENVLFTFSESEGTEVEMDEKDFRVIENARKAFLKAQKRFLKYVQE